MRNLLIVFAVILALGITSMVTGIVYFANIAGFIAAIGFLLVYFKDRPEEESEAEKLRRRNWYIVFFIGMIFALVFGSLWNNKMGGM
jgi:amino acid transporter